MSERYSPERLVEMTRLSVEQRRDLGYPSDVELCMIRDGVTLPPDEALAHFERQAVES